MPLGRYPDRVRAFRKWAQEKVDGSKLSDSATPHRKMRVNRKKRRKRRKRQQDG